MKFILDGGEVTFAEYMMKIKLCGNENEIENLERIRPFMDRRITFDGNPIDVALVDISGNNPILNLILPESHIFGHSSCRWIDSDLRKHLNSEKFVERFNPWFSRHVIPTTIQTGNYSTRDLFWPMSHEEAGYWNMEARTNGITGTFTAFKSRRWAPKEMVFLRSSFGNDVAVASSLVPSLVCTPQTPLQMRPCCSIS